MRVFIDTNKLFSAILFPESMPSKALQKALTTPFEAISSDYCLAELK